MNNGVKHYPETERIVGIVQRPGVPASNLLGTCLACSLPLPLRRPEPGEEGVDWVCVACGTSYHGVLLENWPVEFRRNVCPAAPPPEQDQLPNGADLTAEPAAWSWAHQSHPISIAFPGHRAVPCEMETALSRQLDAEIKSGRSLQFEPQGEPFIARIRKHGATLYDKELMNRLAELLHRSSERLGELFASLKTGGSAEVRVAESISKGGLFRAAEDMDLFVYLGITPGSGGYPSRHALRVAMLAMAIGVSLGWDEQTLLDLGIGCLLHDVGMLRVDGAPYQDKRILSPKEFAEITKHPLFSIQSLREHSDQLPLAARMVAYQMHERCDGTGYPRGYAGNRIHPLAKVAAVADVFVALVSPRPHRPCVVPYHALKKILYDTKTGLYDAEVVRALLKTVSLFPIGSYVALSDGRIGKVVRSGGNPYDRPIIEAWIRGDPLTSRSVIDLSRQVDLRITNTLARLS